MPFVRKAPRIYDAARSSAARRESDRLADGKGFAIDGACDFRMDEWPAAREVRDEDEDDDHGASLGAWRDECWPGAKHEQLGSSRDATVLREFAENDVERSEDPVRLARGRR